MHQPVQCGTKNKHFHKHREPMGSPTGLWHSVSRACVCLWTPNRDATSSALLVVQMKHNTGPAGVSSLTLLFDRSLNPHSGVGSWCCCVFRLNVRKVDQHNTTKQKSMETKNTPQMYHHHVKSDRWQTVKISACPTVSISITSCHSPEDALWNLAAAGRCWHGDTTLKSFWVKKTKHWVGEG